MEEKYGSMTVKVLKELLKQRNASLQGRKKNLIDRLIYYDRNNNFGNEPVIETEPKVQLIETPDAKLYKGVHGSSPVPNLTELHIDEYLKRFNKFRGIANEMYTTGYFQVVRYCNQGNLYYAKGKCFAQIKKHITYEVNISIDFSGEIQEASCECVAGHSTSAHCKHVCVLLLGICDLALKKSMITSQTTTQRLHTFHQPAKKYTGSPMNAKDLKAPRQKKIKLNLTESEDKDSDLWNQTYFRNLIVNCGFNNNMSIKMITTPAKPYGVIADYPYSNYNWEYALLKDLYLIDITDDDVKKIESDTRQQSNSAQWYEYRRYRITASKFFERCKDLTRSRKQIGTVYFTSYKFHFQSCFSWTYI